MELFGLGFRFEDFDGGFYKGFRWPCMAMQRSG